MNEPRIEVVCQGNPREMGLAQGSALRAKIAPGESELTRHLAGEVIGTETAIAPAFAVEEAEGVEVQSIPQSTLNRAYAPHPAVPRKAVRQDNAEMDCGFVAPVRPN